MIVWQQQRTVKAQVKVHYVGIIYEEMMRHKFKAQAQDVDASIDILIDLLRRLLVG